MEYPEPISSMLREFDWNTYMNTTEKMNKRQRTNNVTAGTECYIFCNSKNKSKFPIIIGNIDRKWSDAEYSNEIFFVVHANRNISRANIEWEEKMDVYELPPHIKQEMNLAVTFMHNLKTYFGNNYTIVSESRADRLMRLMNELISLDKIDYLKIISNQFSPLMVATGFHEYDIMKKLIKYYTIDEINYMNRNRQSALTIANNSSDVANNIPRVKIIEEGLKNATLKSIIYAMKYKNVEPGIDVVEELSEYIKIPDAREHSSRGGIAARETIGRTAGSNGRTAGSNGRKNTQKRRRTRKNN